MKATFKKKVTTSFVALGFFIAITFSLISYIAINYVEYDLEHNSNYQHALLLTEIFHKQKNLIEYDTDRFLLFISDDKGDSLHKVPTEIKEIRDSKIELTYQERDYEFIRIKKENLTYYFLFDIENFETAENYTFGSLLVSLVLCVLLSYFLGKKLSAQLTKPIEKLASDIVNHQASSEEALQLSQSHNLTYELDVLSKALTEYSVNLNRIIQREKSFSAHISHEFRTPISVVLGAIEILETDSNQFSERNIVLLKRLTHEIYQLRDIVEMMLLLSKLDADSQHLVPIEKVNVNEIVKATISSLVHQFKFKKLKINFTEEVNVEIFAWKVALVVIIRNVLHNAYSYTLEGEISVQLDQDALVVKDTGPGLTSQKNGVSENSESEFHCGIGLKLSQELAKLQKFSLSLESGTNGFGTIVTINFKEI